MDGEQQWVAAADMLTASRSVDGAEDLPPDSMVDEFNAGISNVCVIGSMALNEAAVGLYLTEPRFAP